MNIQRKLYYEKELDFRVSRSYGPGRYDAAYEQKGRDYPIGYARWTENRNMAFLQLLADGKIDVRTLITQHSGQLMLDDGHSQSMVASLTSGASSDLSGQQQHTIGRGAVTTAHTWARLSHEPPSSISTS